jgi:putative phosphoesterase
MNQPRQVVKNYDLRNHGDLLITILSDTHGVVHPEVNRLATESDVVLHAGDIIGSQVLETLHPRLGVVISVRGNNDLPFIWESHEHGVLDQIPDVAIIQCQGGVISMEHGHLIQNIELDHSALGYKYADSRMVIYGHTHVECIDDESYPWLVNPGAAGRIRNKGGASCYQLKIQGDSWSVRPCKFPDLRKTG